MAVSKQKAVLVTGAAKRLGKAVALEFAAHGYDVALHYHHSRDEAEQTAADIRSLGVQCHLYQQDMAAVEDMDGLMARIAKDLPHLTVLVQAAAMFEPKAFPEMGIEDFRHQMRVNMEGPLFLAQAFAKRVKKGAIVHFIDNYVAEHQTRFFSYLLSKKSLLEATKMLAANLGPGIRVHGVSPGPTLPSPGFDEAYIRARAEKNPLKHLTTPEEIAKSVLWLAETEHLTGQILTLDGGEHLCW
ncbi:SDR family oxidoreductase [bacterium]|nr:SDR family oxidoreductase [bacterium]